MKPSMLAGRGGAVAVRRTIAPTRAEFALAAVWALASAGTLDQYLGIGGVVAFTVAAFAGAPLALRRGLPLLLARVDERRALLLALATYLVLVVAFAVLYPRLNVHSGLRGSDRDDAATIAAQHLLHGRYPYADPTYLGNRISQLPGAVLLATPFAAIGTSAYQNLFWLPALFLCLRWFLGDARLALAALWLGVVASPAALRELVTGGDLISNNAYLLVFGLAVAAAGTRDRPRLLLRAAAAAGLGLALSSRANALLLVPLLFAVVARRDGVRTALGLTAIAGAVAAAVTLPFWAYSPSRFSPLLTAEKVGRFATVLPHATALLVAFGGLVALAAAWRVADTRGAVLAFAFTQALVFGLSVLIASIAAGAADFGFLLLGYGLFALLPLAAVLPGPGRGSARA